MYGALLYSCTIIYSFTRYSTVSSCSPCQGRKGEAHRPQRTNPRSQLLRTGGCPLLVQCSAHTTTPYSTTYSQHAMPCHAIPAMICPMTGRSRFNGVTVLRWQVSCFRTANPAQPKAAKASQQSNMAPPVDEMRQSRRQHPHTLFA
jgi:hypothetical protein